MIKINSYKDVNGISFGSSEHDLISVFGEPIGRSGNSQKEMELVYPDCIFRLVGDTGDLREVTLLPECDASINGQSVFWDKQMLHWLKSEDGELKEVFGFLVSLKLGIVLSGFHDDDESQKTIHAFRNGDWDMFKDRMHPFVIGAEGRSKAFAG